MSTNTVDVLVIGAGPVGLFCANELHRHGLTCRIVDKKQTLSDKSKALGIHVRTLDVLADCNLLPPILSQGHKVIGAIIKAGGKTLVDATLESLPSHRHYLIDLPQDKTEVVFYNALIEKSIPVEWQSELTGITQEKKVVTTLKKENGVTEIVESQWVIACDGAHSTIRHLLQLPFEGSKYKQNWWLADLIIDWELAENRMVIYVSKFGPMACFPMGKKRYRIVMTAPDGQDKSPDLEDIRAAFQKRSSDKATLSHPVWMSSFSIHHRQVAQYRVGNIFLAGDAAHIHSPMGGQGLNTGIQDIYNLVWKLALVHKRLANPDLLDSYHEERHPVGENVLRTTDIMTKMFLLKNPIAIAARNFFLRQALSFEFIKNKLITNLAELNIHYDKSPIVTNLGNNTFFKAGFYLPDGEVKARGENSKETLHTLVQGTFHHLLLFPGKDKSSIPFLINLGKAIQKKYPEAIRVHIIVSDIPSLPQELIWIDENESLQTACKISDTFAVLVRPDKYIALTLSKVKEGELLTYFNYYFN
ncbi:FAD dependent oxidoreductase [Legionella adelaidensis]|uniref:FAD dependent oxidoreductase n=1 Tax=Legionella adelaidensis TaxID=45056 RepID=A0A0W0R6I0_9GAMM|nr:FAD-dependent monooxygenase [Legionella adelaidensis]KTC66649.1 FAD dependent oxidoreductase [Legionella adelaidensis]